MLAMNSIFSVFALVLAVAEIQTQQLDFPSIVESLMKTEQCLCVRAVKMIQQIPIAEGEEVSKVVEVTCGGKMPITNPLYAPCLFIRTQQDSIFKAIDEYKTPEDTCRHLGFCDGVNMKCEISRSPSALSVVDGDKEREIEVRNKYQTRARGPFGGTVILPTFISRDGAIPNLPIELGGLFVGVGSNGASVGIGGTAVDMAITHLASLKADGSPLDLGGGIGEMIHTALVALGNIGRQPGCAVTPISGRPTVTP